jgi:hypothetical protein
MLWITLILALLISAAALAYVIWPLIQTENEPVWVEDDDLSELISRKDATLRSIKSLEFDYQVGKISEEDYQLFNQRLRRQAIAYIQQIEKLAPQTAELDAALEAEIASLRRTVAGDVDENVVEPAASEPAPAAPSAPQPVSQPAAESTNNTARFCPGCGQPVGANHRFCTNCGAQLQVAADKPVQQPAAGSS